VPWRGAFAPHSLRSPGAQRDEVAQSGLVFCAQGSGPAAAELAWVLLLLMGHQAGSAQLRGGPAGQQIRALSGCPVSLVHPGPGMEEAVTRVE
jgi:hypothetical protein